MALRTFRIGRCLSALALSLSSLGALAITPQVSAGGMHTAILRADGTVWSVGANDSGQLGDGGVANSNVPVPAAGLASVTSVATGTCHTLALRSDGTVWAWGCYGVGALGYGYYANSNTPQQVPGLANVVAIAAGAGASFALKSDGTLWGWGDGYSGQLGSNYPSGSATPVQISSISGVVKFSAGANHVLALKGDGTLWAWGDNASGELGNNGTTNSALPVQVQLPGPITDFSAGSNSSLVISNGNVWAWGSSPNGLGQYPVPTQVNGLTDVVAATAGFGGNLALKADGSLWSWGSNGLGQLGIGSVADSLAVRSVSGISGAPAVLGKIAASWGVSAVLGADGKFWSWGNNSYGQIGGYGAGSASPMALVPIEVSPGFSATSLPVGSKVAVNVSSLVGGSVSGGGMSCSTGCSMSLAYGSTLSLVAQPSVGYNFVRWAGNCAGTVGTTCTLTGMNADQTVSAVFSPSSNLVAVTKVGNGAGSVTATSLGIDCGTKCSANAGFGTSVLFTQVASSGTTFLGWQGACTGTGACVVSVDAAKSVYANFALNSSLAYATVTKSGSGTGTIRSATGTIDCGSTCSAFYAPGAVVDLIPVPAAGSTFYSWSGACSTLGWDCVAAVAASGLSANALFNLNPYVPGGSYTPGTIFTVVSNGVQGFSGDGGQATSAQFQSTMGAKADTKGNFFVADWWNGTVRKIAPNGVITTIAGDATVAANAGVAYSCGYQGDGGLATLARLCEPVDVAIDAAGNVFIADEYNRVIRKVDTAGVISTVAGVCTMTADGCVGGYGGDGGPASAALFESPRGLAFDPAGNLYVSDKGNQVIRKIAAVGGQVTPASVITTVAGNCANATGGCDGAYGGDGGPATSASLNYPRHIAFDAAGNLYIADDDNYLVRKVIAQNGAITPSSMIVTVAGSCPDPVNGCSSGYAGDGGAATNALMSLTYGIAVDRAGNIYIGDDGNAIVRKVDTKGVISTFAGVCEYNGTGCSVYTYDGDGGPATQAHLLEPDSVSVGADGSVYITNGYVIRKVQPASVSVTVAGGGSVSDGQSACQTACSFSFPYDGGTTLTATPASGYAFSGWAGACAGQAGNVCTFDHVTTNQAATATFVSLAPGAPTIGLAVGGNAQATVAFTAPSIVGAGPVTSYTVTASPGGKTAVGTASPIIVKGLTNGTSYTFTVTATNAYGQGQPSSPSNRVTPATVPTAPKIGTATATRGSRKATVSFTPPTSNGGSPITLYTVTSTPGNITATGKASPITVTGLTSGIRYTFKVTATNAVGVGPASSASNAVTP